MQADDTTVRAVGTAHSVSNSVRGSDEGLRTEPRSRTSLDSVLQHSVLNPSLAALGE
jgi:hypothetical protein